jgi:hypothetical protein
MEFFAFVQYAVLAFCLVTGCAVLLFVQLRTERALSTVTVDGLARSRARSIAVLNDVIKDLRDDILWEVDRGNRRETHSDSLISCAQVTMSEQATQIIQDEHTISELRALVTRSLEGLESMEVLQKRAARVSSALNDFKPEALALALPALKAESKAVNVTARYLRNFYRDIWSVENTQITVCDNRMEVDDQSQG